MGEKVLLRRSYVKKMNDLKGEQMMRKVRRAHLWIGLIASVFIFMEAVTGLLLTEPWLIGQSERGPFDGGLGIEARGNFQPGQFNQGQNAQWPLNTDPGQTNGTQRQSQSSIVGNRQGRFSGYTNFKRDQNQGSFMNVIRGLHEGRIGNTNIKWLIDLVAIAMMFLTGTGIYLSINILRAEKKRKNRPSDRSESV